MFRAPWRKLKPPWKSGQEDNGCLSTAVPFRASFIYTSCGRSSASPLLPRGIPACPDVQLFMWSSDKGSWLARARKEQKGEPGSRNFWGRGTDCSDYYLFPAGSGLVCLPVPVTLQPFKAFKAKKITPLEIITNLKRFFNVCMFPDKVIQVELLFIFTKQRKMDLATQRLENVQVLSYGEHADIW